MATRMKATGSVALVILALALGYWASHRSGDSGMNKNVVVGVPADSSTTRAPKESVRDARGAIEVRCDYQDYFPDKGKRKVPNRRVAPYA